MGYRVVFFDWDKTLCHSRFWDIWKGGELDNKYAELQEKLWVDKELIDNWMIGKVNSEQISSMAAEMLDMTYTEVFDGLVASVKNMKISETVTAKINALKKTGTKVVIATDNMDTFTRWTVPALGLAEMFDEIICSFDIRARKPHKDISGDTLFFKDFMTRHKLRPHESVLLDDSNNNSIVNDFGIDYIKIENDNLESQLDRLLEIAKC